MVKLMDLLCSSLFGSVSIVSKGFVLCRLIFVRRQVIDITFTSRRRKTAQERRSFLFPVIDFDLASIKKKSFAWRENMYLYRWVHNLVHTIFAPCF
jgi:hypothetical protein